MTNATTGKRSVESGGLFLKKGPGVLDDDAYATPHPEDMQNEELRRRLTGSQSLDGCWKRGIGK